MRGRVDGVLQVKLKASEAQIAENNNGCQKIPLTITSCQEMAKTLTWCAWKPRPRSEKRSNGISQEPPWSHRSSGSRKSINKLLRHCLRSDITLVKKIIFRDLLISQSLAIASLKEISQEDGSWSSHRSQKRPKRHLCINARLDTNLMCIAWPWLQITGVSSVLDWTGKYSFTTYRGEFILTSF